MSQRICPDTGESESADGKKFPSDLAKSHFIKSTPDTFSYLEKVVNVLGTLVEEQVQVRPFHEDSGDRGGELGAFVGREIRRRLSTPRDAVDN
jgi:hypothetical protein